MMPCSDGLVHWCLFHAQCVYVTGERIKQNSYRKPLVIFCDCTARFVSDMIGNPEGRFCHDTIQIVSFRLWSRSVRYSVGIEMPRIRANCLLLHLCSFRLKSSKMYANVFLAYLIALKC